MNRSRACDVIVVGLGAMGSAVSYELARRGQRVLGLERFGPVHSEGSSHGGTRLVRQVCWEDPAYVPLAQRAFELWRDTERVSGEVLVRSTGGLLLGPPESVTVAAACAVAGEFDLSHEVLSAAELRRRFPTLRPADDTIGFFDPTGGVVSPELTVATFLRSAEEAGADLHFYEAAIHWSVSEAGSVTVTTAAGTYTAGRLVICPGPWAPELLGDVGVPFAVQRLVTTWFEPVGGVAPFLPDRHPWWLWDLDGGHRVGFAEFLYGFPAVDGPDGGVKLSRVLEQPCSADELDRAVSEDEVEAVAALLRTHVTVPLARLVRAGVCMWTNTPDHHFVLGEHPLHRQVIVAGGCCGAAFKFVPVIGEIVADLVVDGKTAQAIELFAPGRGGVFAEI